MKLTDLEIKGLLGICNSDYQDGALRIGNPVWTWSANPFENARTFSGIMSQLTQKGLAVTEGNSKNDACWITQKGMDALIELGLAKEHWYK